MTRRSSCADCALWDAMVECGAQAIYEKQKRSAMPDWAMCSAYYKIKFLEDAQTVLFAVAKMGNPVVEEDKP